MGDAAPVDREMGEKREMREGETGGAREGEEGGDAHLRVRRRRGWPDEGGEEVAGPVVGGSRGVVGWIGGKIEEGKVVDTDLERGDPEEDLVEWRRRLAGRMGHLPKF